MAYSCKANAILSFDYLNTSNLETSLSTVAAYEYGRNLGIAFQLVDDILGKFLWRYSNEMQSIKLVIVMQLILATFYSQ